MKYAILALTLLLSQTSFAQTSTPECNDDLSIVPCRVPASEVPSLMGSMLLNNVKGYLAVTQKATVGFEMEEVVATVILDKTNQPAINGNNYIMEIRYDISLNDCHGHDDCRGSYLWSVTEHSEGDGYLSQTTYTDTLSRKH